MTESSAKQRQDREQVYAILRVDEFQGDLPVERKVTVKAVVRSLEIAQAEVNRLNLLRPACYYFWQATRFINAAVAVREANDSSMNMLPSTQPAAATFENG